MPAASASPGERHVQGEAGAGEEEEKLPPPPAAAAEPPGEIGENAPPPLTPQRKTPAPCTATASVAPPSGSREIPATPRTLRLPGWPGLESEAASEKEEEEPEEEEEKGFEEGCAAAAVGHACASRAGGDDE